MADEKSSEQNQESNKGVKGLDEISALEAKPGVGAESQNSEYKPPKPRIFDLFTKINPYLIMFIVVIVLALIVAIIANKINEDNDPTNLTFEGTELTQEALEKLKLSEQKIGDVNQTLTVAANAIFNGKVLVKNDLDVAGTIRVGETVELPGGITATGTSQFDSLNIANELTVLGDSSIQGSITVQESLNVNGNASVGGTLSASKISADVLEFNGDLSLTKHIDTGGATPKASSGTAVGSGGTVSISGNDISGTVTINTGGSPPAGILIKVTFATPYNSTPNVQITPIGSNTASLDWYVTRDLNSFSIGTINPPSASTTYIFDFFVSE